MRACCHKVCHVSVIPSQTFCLVSLLPGARVYMRPAYAQRCTTCGLQCLPCLHAQPGCALYLDGGGDVSLSAQGSRAGRCLQAQLQQLLQPHQAKLLQPPLPQPPQQASHCPTSCDVHACASTTGQHFTYHASTPCSDSREAIVHICKSTADSWMN